MTRIPYENLKITSSMRKWCRHLAAGRDITRNLASPDGPFDTERYSYLTAAMAKALAETGLIAWAPLGTTKQCAVLTAYGRMAAAEAPGARQPATKAGKATYGLAVAA